MSEDIVKRMKNEATRPPWITPVNLLLEAAAEITRLRCLMSNHEAAVRCAINALTPTLDEMAKERADV